MSCFMIQLLSQCLIIKGWFCIVLAISRMNFMRHGSMFIKIRSEYVAMFYTRSNRGAVFYSWAKIRKITMQYCKTHCLIPIIHRSIPPWAKSIPNWFRVGARWFPSPVVIWAASDSKFLSKTMQIKRNSCVSLRFPITGQRPWAKLWLTKVDHKLTIWSSRLGASRNWCYCRNEAVTLVVITVVCVKLSATVSSPLMFEPTCNMPSSD